MPQTPAIVPSARPGVCSANCGDRCARRQDCSSGGACARHRRGAGCRSGRTGPGHVVWRSLERIGVTGALDYLRPYAGTFGHRWGNRRCDRNKEEPQRAAAGEYKGQGIIQFGKAGSRRRARGLGGGTLIGHEQEGASVQCDRESAERVAIRRRRHSRNPRDERRLHAMGGGDDSAPGAT